MQRNSATTTPTKSPHVATETVKFFKSASSPPRTDQHKSSKEQSTNTDNNKTNDDVKPSLQVIVAPSPNKQTSNKQQQSKNDTSSVKQSLVPEFVSTTAHSDDISSVASSFSSSASLAQRHERRKQQKPKQQKQSLSPWKRGQQLSPLQQQKRGDQKKSSAQRQQQPPKKDREDGWILVESPARPKKQQQPLKGKKKPTHRRNHQRFNGESTSRNQYPHNKQGISTPKKNRAAALNLDNKTPSKTPKKDEQAVSTPKTPRTQSKKEFPALTPSKTSSAVEVSTDPKIKSLHQPQKLSTPGKGDNNKKGSSSNAKQASTYSTAVAPKQQVPYLTRIWNARPLLNPETVLTHPSGLSPSALKQWLNYGQCNGAISPKDVMALDCEFCGVGPDAKKSQLARVTLVDFDGNVLLDCHVRPQEPVTDYRTHVSGVTTYHVNSPQAIEFETCRKIVQGWLHSKPIVVGHGLAADFAVMKLMHPWYCLRDSATYPPLMRYDCTPKRLKVLMREELSLRIQDAGKQHCSIVDATAAMWLYRHKKVEWDAHVHAQICDMHSGAPSYPYAVPTFR